MFCEILFFLSLILSVSYLDQDILAEAREGIFEAIKTDVMPLPHSAAHTIAHLLSAAPLPVLTHAVNNRACYTSTVQVFPFKAIYANNHFTRCCSPRRWSVLMHMACCCGNRGTVPVQCSLCGDVPEINPLLNRHVLF